jgi:pyridoxine/pyridoxamine 5'-phosphate oxidase
MHILRRCSWHKLYHVLSMQSNVIICVDALSQKVLESEEKRHITMINELNPCCWMKFEIHNSQSVIIVINGMANIIYVLIESVV